MMYSPEEIVKILSFVKTKDDVFEIVKELYVLMKFYGNFTSINSIAKLSLLRIIEIESLIL